MAIIPSPAMDAACSRLVAQAAKTAEALIDARAGKFAQRPKLLNAIEPGLSSLSPRRLFARVDDLLERERETPRTIFGGEVILINLVAAKRYAEQLLAIEARRKEPRK